MERFDNTVATVWRELNEKVEEKISDLKSGIDSDAQRCWFEEYLEQAKAQVQTIGSQPGFVPKTPGKRRGPARRARGTSRAAGAEDLPDQTLAEPSTRSSRRNTSIRAAEPDDSVLENTEVDQPAKSTKRKGGRGKAKVKQISNPDPVVVVTDLAPEEPLATARTTRRTTRARTEESVLEETPVDPPPRKSVKRSRNNVQSSEDDQDAEQHPRRSSQPAAKKVLRSNENDDEEEQGKSEEAITSPELVTENVEMEEVERPEESQVIEVAVESVNPTEGPVIVDEVPNPEPNSPQVIPRKSLVFEKQVSPVLQKENEESNNSIQMAEEITADDENLQNEEPVEMNIEIDAESEGPVEDTEAVQEPSASDGQSENEEKEEEQKNQTITIEQAEADIDEVPADEKENPAEIVEVEETPISDSRRLTITKSPGKVEATAVEVDSSRPVRSTRTKTRAAKDVENTAETESQTTRRQTRTKTRAADSSADEETEQESRRRTRSKIHTDSKTQVMASVTREAEAEVEPRSRRQTRSKTKCIEEPTEEIQARRQTRSKVTSGQESEASEVEEAGPVRQTRTKTRQLNKAQSEATLTKSAASPRVRELAAAVMSPVKRSTPTRTVGYTGSPIRDRVKVFEQAMKESAGLKSSSDSEKESVPTPSRYHTPGRRSSIARNLRKVSAARNVPVSTILSEASVEVIEPPKKGPIIRKSPPKPKENLNNSRAPTGKIVKPGRKVAASGGRGVSPATGPRSGTGSSSLMKSRSRMELIQKAGRTTPSGKGPNLVTGVTSLVPQKPKGPTIEEIQAKKEEERKQKEQREIEARKRREEQLKSKAEEAKRQREERIRRVQDARQKQESKKEQELARKEKENNEKLAVLKKREELHKEAERKKKREQEELQREEEERQARAEELRKKDQLRKEEDRRRLEERKREEEKRRLEEKKRSEEKRKLEEKKKAEEIERIKREKLELAKLKQREAERTTDLDSTYSKPADATFNKPGDATFNMTQPSEQTCSSYDITPARHELPPQPLQNENDYGLEDLNSGTDTDDEDNPKKEVPKWAEGAELRTALLKQCYMGPDPEEIFLMRGETPDLSVIFTHQRKRFFKRTSSACWDTAPIEPQ